jgi:hypothetical protein
MYGASEGPKGGLYDSLILGGLIRALAKPSMHQHRRAIEAGTIPVIGERRLYSPAARRTSRSAPTNCMRCKPPS